MTSTGETVDIAAIRAALAAATPGPWYSGTALVAAENPDDNYWAETDVYALDADPAIIVLTNPTDGESNCRDKEAWCDDHERGLIAQTHNYYPIPEEQHDANNRLIGNAPVWLAALCDEIERLSADLDEAQVWSIVARNPGIDEAEVRRVRAQSGRKP